MKYICRQWTKDALNGWTSEIDTFNTREEAEQHGETFKRLIRRDDIERGYEVYPQGGEADE